MKTLPILYAASLIASSLGASQTRATVSSDYNHQDALDKIIIPPLGTYNPPKFIIKASSSYTPTNITHMSIQLFNYLNPGGKNLLHYQTLDKEFTYVYTYEGVTSPKYDDSFRFTFLNDKYYDVIDIPAKYVDSKSIIVNEDSKSIEFEANVAHYTYRYGLYYEKEKIDITSIKSIAQDLSKSFSFNDFSIKQTNTYLDDIQMSVGNINAMISNGSNLFGDIGTTVGTYKMLNLKTKTVFNAELKLDYPIRAYVDPITHQMSASRKTNYLQTRSLFFPTNLELGKKFPLSIGISDYGINESSIRIDCEVVISKKILGNCVNSDYCLTSVSARNDGYSSDNVSG